MVGVSFSLLFVIRILRDSMTMFSWSCFEQKEINLFVSILDQSLAQGRIQLEPFGLAGVESLQSIAEALLIICGNKINSSSFSRCVQFWLLLRPFTSGFSLWTFLAYWTTLRAKCFPVLLWPVSSSVCVEPTSILLVDFFVDKFESCHTDPRFRQWLFYINTPIIMDGCLVKYINARLRWSLDINVLQMYRKNRHSEQKVSS